MHIYHVILFISLLFNSTINLAADSFVVCKDGICSEQAEDAETRALNRIREIEESAAPLLKQVQHALANKGRLKPMHGYSGAYRVLDRNGNTVALFKPEDERDWGPNNRMPDHRRQDSTLDDIHFHQMNAFEQGQTTARQHLAKLLDFGSTANVPLGTVTYLESDQFVDLEAEKLGITPRKQRKRGYLQVWVPNAKSFPELHPKTIAGQAPPEEAYQFDNHPLLDTISLDEYQKVALLDILMYNEDRHPGNLMDMALYHSEPRQGNLLITFDDQREPHLTPIDCDAILPFKLNKLRSILAHRRAKVAFSNQSLHFIEELDPEVVAALVQQVNLPPQAVTNAKALTLVIKAFAKAGLQLSHIYNFAASKGEEDSALWQMMQQAETVAIESLSSEDQAKRKHRNYLRRLLWSKKNVTSDDQKWLENYLTHDAQRIEAAVNRVFWSEFSQQLNSYVSKLSENNRISANILARAHERIRQVESKAKPLIKKVHEVLANHGRLVPVVGTSAYLVVDHHNENVAVFKPEDERNNGPSNRLPEKRGPDHTFEDIYFHQMSSFEQGSSSIRQHLAKLLDFGSIANLPAGAIVELQSDQFVDVEAEILNTPPRLQTKRGYLQKWVPNAKPLVDLHPQNTPGLAPSREAYLLENHALLNSVSLDEFQKIALMNVLLYNEIQHPGDILISYDAYGSPHLKPIDSDSILPFKLSGLTGILRHERVAKPFSTQSLQFIAELDPHVVATLVESTGLPQQAVTNAKALAMVIKAFAKTGRCLSDIATFLDKNDQGSSELWDMMQESLQAAINSLSPEDQAMHNHRNHIRWLLWNGSDAQATSEDHAWLERSLEYHRERIETTIDQAFWHGFSQRLQARASN